MEFDEKLQTLRKARGLTQEELAEALFVSRAAISKWESGRGYPNIDSLKVLAAFFSVSVDELIRSEEVITLADQDKKESVRRFTLLSCAALDMLLSALLFLPVFATGNASAVSAPVYALENSAARVLFMGVILLTALNGLCGVILLRFDRPVWHRHRLVTGLVLSLIGTMLFIAARQPYAGFMFVSVLAVKALLLYLAK